ncbi:transcription termination factor NusA [Porphyromonas macacae]|uniref:Transcription termination/antitermination protein NusA n=1 Tax=Porphyromonas macacae TaxID=28115 RepID=A0A379DJ53_9PORP|nr:transcription termination factor NusA [Porphyromonas macacae]SUB78053.1 Transcription elongation protein nusA [Porphyromonas macacae]
MAKKQETTSLTESLSEYKELKDIDKDTLINVLEDSFRNVLTKMFGTDESFDVIINPEKGDFEIWRTRTVVTDEEAKGENFNSTLQVSLTEAHKIDPEAEVGESVTDSVDFSSFGRRAVLNLRQALSSKVLELQKEYLYNRFSKRVGELISAEVYQVWKREALLIDDENNELLLPKSEQIPGDFYRKGETVHAVIERVENENNNPRIILSRTSGEFLKRLLELNVPEIADGLITVKCVARVPGERAKIAVESYDDRIDPVGACVGMNGSRIRGIVRELKGENIDVIPFTNNKLLFIQRALNPAKISAVNLNEEEHEAEVYMRPEEVPLAIGKNASNLKLASLLTGYRIEVFRDLENPIEEDIYLDEFSDEIESWVLDILKNAGYTTAKPVLRQDRDTLIKQTDLEESTIDNVLHVLRSEFEDDEENVEEGDWSDGDEREDEGKNVEVE